MLINFPFARTVSAEDEASSFDPGDNNNPYVYEIEIEFGSLGFFYDYGVWNVNTFSYETDVMSKNPAADTVEGYPGWYGFDGVANKITVKNHSLTIDQGAPTDSVSVEISFTGFTSSDVSQNASVISGISMYCYDGADLKNSNCLNTGENIYEFDIKNGEDKELYISFSGEPKNSDGSSFISLSAKPIGFITLTVS